MSPCLARLDRRAVAVIAGASLAAGCRYDWPLDGAEPPATDGGVVAVEGGLDGAVGPRSCADGPSLFCDPFDEGRIEAHWDRAYVSSTAGVRIEPFDSAPSGPNALFVTLPSKRADELGYAYVGRNLDATSLASPVSRATLSFSVRAGAMPSTARACAAGLVFDEGRDGRHALRLFFGRNDAYLQEQGGDVLTNAPLKRTVPLGAWARVALSVEVGGRVVVRVDEEVVVDVAARETVRASDSLRFVVGINFIDAPSTEPFSFHYDDVRLDGD